MIHLPSGEQSGPLSKIFFERGWMIFPVIGSTCQTPPLLRPITSDLPPLQTAKSPFHMSFSPSKDSVLSLVSMDVSQNFDCTSCESSLPSGIQARPIPSDLVSER